MAISELHVFSFPFGNKISCAKYDYKTVTVLLVEIYLEEFYFYTDIQMFPYWKQKGALIFCTKMM
jgi:hypothetical protein